MTRVFGLFELWFGCGLGALWCRFEVVSGWIFAAFWRAGTVILGAYRPRLRLQFCAWDEYALSDRMIGKVAAANGARLTQWR
jgi:hypothetical protein